MADQTQAKDQDDILWGATEIARVAGLPDRASAYNLLTHGHLPWAPGCQASSCFRLQSALCVIEGAIVFEIKIDFSEVRALQSGGRDD